MLRCPSACGIHPGVFDAQAWHRKKQNRGFCQVSVSLLLNAIYRFCGGAAEFS
jgi:hypothetical protein